MLAFIRRPRGRAALAGPAHAASHQRGRGRISRHPIHIESAVYFVCVEGLQNAMKHAHTASGVWVQLTEHAGSLHFEVRDDGPGFTPDGDPQRGLRNMHDRIDAIGGHLTIETSPGHGTRIVGAADTG